MPCDSPFYVTPKGYLEAVPVPCGRCPPCKKRRVDSWVFRLLQEEKRSATAFFITLTYDPAHVPISPNGFMTLDKGEFPRYMKRLRKLCPGANLKYYACGEYGSKNKRPHYHAIVFNVPFDHLFFDAWSLGGVPFGQVHVGNVSGNSVAYTMKYIDKSTWSAKHARDDREPEFALMSKGLGSNYLTEDVKQWHLNDLRRLYCVRDGRKVALPRYYRERIFVYDDSGEQRRLVAEAVAKADADNRDLWMRVSPGISYEHFCETQRLQRYRTFYSHLKSRL